MRATFTMNVLIVDSDAAYQKQLRTVFDTGVNIDWIDNPLDGISKCVVNDYTLVIATDMFTAMSGVNFLIAAKRVDAQVLTVLLTKKIDDKDDLFALESGVDCVISSQRSLRIIGYYINTLLKKAKHRITNQLVLMGSDGTCVDLRAHKVMVNDKLIDITPKEYEILVLLLKNKNNVLDRYTIVECIWKEKVELVDERTVDVHIKRLRDKLETVSIASVRGVGYIWRD